MCIRDRCAIIQAYHLGFQTLKINKNATQINDDLKNISKRFITHFDNIILLRKKLEEAIKLTEDFGRDARSIKNVLESIKNRGDNDNDDDDPDPRSPVTTFLTEEKRKVS